MLVNVARDKTVLIFLFKSFLKEGIISITLKHILNKQTANIAPTQVGIS